MSTTFIGKAGTTKISAICTGWIMSSFAIATLAAPAASAAPDCSSERVANTVSSATGSAQQYLATHPGAGQVLYGALAQPQPQAAANIRGYFTANPQEYYELRGILAPIGDVQNQCNVSVLPPNLSAAYAQFMAG